MNDIEKVCDAFRNCITEPKCRNCPWEQCSTIKNKKVEIPIDLALEVNNLLFDYMKKQEAVEPSFRQDEKGIFVWCCGSCGAYLYHIYDGIDKAKEYAKYCRQCGKKVKWE